MRWGQVSGTGTSDSIMSDGRFIKTEMLWNVNDPTLRKTTTNLLITYSSNSNTCSTNSNIFVKCTSPPRILVWHRLLSSCDTYWLVELHLIFLLVSFTICQKNLFVLSWNRHGRLHTDFSVRDSMRKLSWLSNIAFLAANQLHELISVGWDVDDGCPKKTL